MLIKQLLNLTVITALTVESNVLFGLLHFICLFKKKENPFCCFPNETIDFIRHILTAVVVPLFPSSKFYRLQGIIQEQRSNATSCGSPAVLDAMLCLAYTLCSVSSGSYGII